MYSPSCLEEAKKRRKNSVVEQIVNKEQGKADEKKEPNVAPKIESKPKKKKKPLNLYRSAKLFMNATIIFILLSAAFLYVEFVDKDNGILSLIGVEENTGGKLERLTDEVSEKQREEAVLNQKIAEFWIRISGSSACNSGSSHWI